MTRGAASSASPRASTRSIRAAGSMGGDIAGGRGPPGEDAGGGGALGVTKGLSAKYPGRVIATPIAEAAYVGAAAGAAAAGLRPIAELMFVDFLGVCLDQIF